MTPPATNQAGAARPPRRASEPHWGPYRPFQTPWEGAGRLRLCQGLVDGSVCGAEARYISVSLTSRRSLCPACLRRLSTL
jgi:hypothetical protein